MWKQQKSAWNEFFQLWFCFFRIGYQKARQWCLCVWMFGMWSKCDDLFEKRGDLKWPSSNLIISWAKSQSIDAYQTVIGWPIEMCLRFDGFVNDRVPHRVTSCIFAKASNSLYWQERKRKETTPTATSFRL